MQHPGKKQKTFYHYYRSQRKQKLLDNIVFFFFFGILFLERGFIGVFGAGGVTSKFDTGGK